MGNVSFAERRVVVRASHTFGNFAENRQDQQRHAVYHLPPAPYSFFLLSRPTTSATAVHIAFTTPATARQTARLGQVLTSSVQQFSCTAHLLFLRLCNMQPQHGTVTPLANTNRQTWDEEPTRKTPACSLRYKKINCICIRPRSIDLVRVPEVTPSLLGNTRRLPWPSSCCGLLTPARLLPHARAWPLSSAFPPTPAHAPLCWRRDLHRRLWGMSSSTVVKRTSHAGEGLKSARDGEKSVLCNAHPVRVEKLELHQGGRCWERKKNATETSNKNYTANTLGSAQEGFPLKTHRFGSGSDVLLSDRRAVSTPQQSRMC